MPHTSHRKKVQRTKRIEVEDEDGWTRVATNNISQRRPRPLPAQAALEERYACLDKNSTVEYPENTLSEDQTIDKVEAQYRKFEKIWLDSESCKELERCLQQEIDIEILREVDECFVFGTGTFSGSTRGWIDRSHVAMYQLAAFMSVVKAIERITGTRPMAFAQEPVYNHLDVEFLSHLQVTVLETPTGFTGVSTRSFTYIPNAELDVELRVIARDPAMVMINGKLERFWRNADGEACTNVIKVNTQVTDSREDEKTNDDNDQGRLEASFKSVHELTEQEKQNYGRIDSLYDEIEEGMQVCEEFKKGKGFWKLPSFEARDEPFYQVYLYYAQVIDDGDVFADKGDARIHS